MSEYEILNNRYYLERQLGSGGMAVVYRAQDLMLERVVALKILREKFSGNMEFRNRFRQEARAVANLSHPNIVTIHDFGLHENRLYIVMEYVPGTDLKAIMNRYGKIGIDDGIRLIIQACEGIGYAHQSGIVHCDIKPQNLLVTPEKKVRVVDFGIARALATISPDEKTDVVWGSPKYFSPEQASGNPPLPASDVYSLGVVLYETLTGQVPFHADTPVEMARLHRDVPPPSPRKLNPLIPKLLEELLMTSLSKKASDRFENAQVMSIALKHTQGSLQMNGETSYTFSIPPALDNTSQEFIRGSQTNLDQPQPTESRAISPSRKRSGTAVQDTKFDLVTWTLVLLAIIAVGGLIPFWLWVYYFVYPPVQ